MAVCIVWVKDWMDGLWIHDLRKRTCGGRDWLGIVCVNSVSLFEGWEAGVCFACSVVLGIGYSCAMVWCKNGGVVVGVDR